jgi:tetratricopeptide (TPR) repeat protein
MPHSPNKLSQFWQELKRRKVIHVITVYASAAFVIIELIGNLSEPLNLPTSLSTIVIIVLAVGFPPAIILSWLYDLTAGSFERTGPMEDVQEEEKAKVPNAWKIATYVSFLVIAGLVVFNIVSRRDVLKPGMIQSLAILPFDNFTGDEKLDYVADGMHTALVGDMGRLGALRVTGKNSSSIFKDSGKSAPDIARELDVEALVEPAVMFYGDSIIIQIKLITLYPQEKQLFVEDYMVDRSQVLNLFSKISKQIADEILIELSPEEERLFAKSRTVDKEAYDDYLKALGAIDFSRESLYKAMEYLNHAVEKEPDWAPLYAGLALVWLDIQQMGLEPTSITSPKIYENLNKALELDPDFSDSHTSSAMIAYLMDWDWEKSEKEFLKALAINPSDAGSRVFYAHLLCILQRYDEALPQAQLALELDPLNPNMKLWASFVLMAAGDFKSALELGEEVAAADPNYYMAYSVIENAAYYYKDYKRVMEASKHLLAWQVDFKEVDRIFGENGFVAANEEILRQLELVAQNGFVAPVGMAQRYMMVDQADQALEWLEKGFEVRDPNMPYIATKGYLLDSLFDHPGFMEIIQKMNLPLPISEPVSTQ